MNYEAINTSKGCGRQSWYSKRLLQQITSQLCVLKKQSGHWLFQAARNKNNGTWWCWRAQPALLCKCQPQCQTRGNFQGRFTWVLWKHSSAEQQRTVLSLAWAPVKGLTPTCSCILSHPMLATACLAKLSASVQAVSCLWWQKGLAQLSSPVSDRNKLIPAAFSPELRPTQFYMSLVIAIFSSPNDFCSLQLKSSGSTRWEFEWPLILSASCATVLCLDRSFPFLSFTEMYVQTQRGQPVTCGDAIKLTAPLPQQEEPDQSQGTLRYLQPAEGIGTDLHVWQSCH